MSKFFMPSFERIQRLRATPVTQQMAFESSVAERVSQLSMRVGEYSRSSKPW